ncbi:MAG: hypothetical protein H6Q16_1047 [Bacteroidetes bacterium]|nr:hypothetical protein [Bacteroidota bacterium]
MKIINCKITAFNLIVNIVIPLAITVGWGYIVGLLLFEREFTLGWIIIELMITFIWFFGGLYSLYACYKYYKHDSKVKMQITLFDEEKIQITYQYKKDPVKIINIQDIIKIERYYFGRVGPEFYVLFIKNGEELIISSLLSKTDLLLSKCNTRSFNTLKPIPDEW